MDPALSLLQPPEVAGITGVHHRTWLPYFYQLPSYPSKVRLGSRHAKGKTIVAKVSSQHPDFTPFTLIL